MATRALVPVFFIVLVDLLALTMIVPLLPFYAQKFGAGAMTIGLLSSAFALCQLIASPVLGRLSDKYGRKSILLVSQLGTFAGLLLMAGAESLPLLFLARVLDGFTAGNLPIAQAFIADVTTPEERAGAFAKIGVAFGLGLILGPATAGWLTTYGWTVPIYAAAGMSLLSLVLTATLLPAVSARSTATKQRTKQPVKPPYDGRHRLLRRFAPRNDKTRPDTKYLWAFGVFTLAFGYFQGGFALVAQEKLNFGPKEVGFLFAYCGVLGVVIQGGLVAPLARRFGERALAGVGFAAAALGYGLLGVAPGLAVFVVGCTCFSIGNSLLRPSLTSLVSRSVAASEQGAVLGLTGSIQSAGMFLGPLAGNALLERGDTLPWSLALSVLCVIPLCSHLAQVSPRSSRSSL